MGLGKGGSAPEPPPVTQAPEPDYTPMLAMMQQMMSVMGQQAPAPPPIPNIPPIVKTQEIDWGERTKQLQAKMKADYNVAKAKKKGRLNTVFTSPLLDEDEPATTKTSLLSEPADA